MNKEEQINRQNFFNEICKYQYISPDGFLTLEPFGVYLSHCFGFDGILEKSPMPYDVYCLLLQIIEEDLPREAFKEYVKLVPIKNWTPDLAYVYPQKLMTYVHVSALIHVSHHWIFEIGNTLMNIPTEEESPKYFYWANEEWTAVFQFINGYHNFFMEYQKKVDLDSIQKKGYSIFEALHLSKAKNISMDHAIEILKSRHDAYQIALNKIHRAIEFEFYLEAINLTENLISNCIYNYLVGCGENVLKSNFHGLILHLLNLKTQNDTEIIALFNLVDKWRRDRNNSVHGFVQTKSDGLTRSSEEFLLLSQATANDGEVLCKQIVSWYEKQCIDFIKHEFTSGKITKH